MGTKTLKIGTKIPEFSLPAVDGKTYSLNSFKDAKSLVIFFSCNHCPYVQVYEDRIINLQNEFRGKGVAFAAINSNDDSQYPDDSFEEMKKRALKKGFNFPYLRDESQITALEFDASHTPEFFVFDGERKLVYHGKLDDNWQDISQVRNNYLKDALNELLEGKEISVPETYSIGCTIKWKL